MTTASISTQAPSKAYNDKAEAIVGRRLFSEKCPEPRPDYPSIKALLDVFEMENKWDDFLLPDNWDAEKDRLMEGNLMEMGVKPPLTQPATGPYSLQWWKTPHNEKLLKTRPERIYTRLSTHPAGSDPARSHPLPQ